MTEARETLFDARRVVEEIDDMRARIGDIADELESRNHPGFCEDLLDVKMQLAAVADLIETRFDV